MAENTPPQAADQGTWVTWRQDIKVLDCSIRDGGLMNNHRFEDGFVRARSEEHTSELQSH